MAQKSRNSRGGRQRGQQGSNPQEEVQASPEAQEPVASAQTTGSGRIEPSVSSAAQPAQGYGSRGDGGSGGGGYPPSPGHEAEEGARFPQVLWLLALILLAGLGISGYLTRHHEIEVHGDHSAELGNCPQTETVNCEAVNSSEYSELFGIPIAVFAIPTYLLLLSLLWRSRKEPRALAYAFGIGLLTVAYSGYLFYVSKYKIGFLCLWCMRMYGINTSIPLLVGLAWGRNPFPLVSTALKDLLSWPKPLVRTAVSFGVLSLVTVVAQQGYRASLSAAPAGETSSEASSSSDTSAKSSSAPGDKKTASAPDTTEDGSPIPEIKLNRLSFDGSQVQATPFDLDAVLGKGKPVGLLFWAPGFSLAEVKLVELSRWLRKEAPEIDLYAVSGMGPDYKHEYFWETYSMLDVPGDLPLIIDEGFELSRSLKLQDVPNLVLYSGDGTLITTSFKSLESIASFSPRRMTGEELVRAVVKDEVKAQVKTAPYYPGNELVGKCAPSFTIPDFATQKPYKFNGPSKSGKPTLMVFWSSTCKHCQKEIPKMVEHYKAHSSEYDIVSVTSIKPDREGFSHREMTQRYIENQGITWPVLEDVGGAVGELYNIVSTPTTYLIAPSGEVVGAWFFVHEEYDKAIEAALTKMNGATGECTPPPRPELGRINLTMTSPGGDKVELSSLTKKPTLVHLWATWCQPCRKELPSLLRFRDIYEKQGGKVVFVSVEDEDAGPAITQFAQDNKLRFDSFRAPRGGLAEKINLNYSVPRTFIVLSDGRVFRTLYGEQKWDEPSFRDAILSRLTTLK